LWIRTSTPSPAGTDSLRELRTQHGFPAYGHLVPRSSSPRTPQGDPSAKLDYAKTPLSRLLTWGDERGWLKLRLLSSAANTYNRDYFGEAADGSQYPMLNVFHRDGGTIRHFWGAELTFAPADPGQDHRSVGTLEPLWNLFDLTREGRPDWDERLSY
jgi:predicted dithiol-disulfide oxidoreductase (DUF899 family)